MSDLNALFIRQSAGDHSGLFSADAKICGVIEKGVMTWKPAPAIRDRLNRPEIGSCHLHVKSMVTKDFVKVARKYKD